MELVLKQRIYYSNRKAIPVHEIAEALLALDGLFRQSPSVLETLFPGTTIQRVEVFLDELKSDSLFEDIVVKFIFGSQERFDAFVSSLREKIGMDNIMKNNQILSAIVISMILLGGAYYLGKDNNAEPGRQTTIEANNNVIINVGAGMLEMDGEELRAIIETSIKDKNKLARDAIKFVKPAKRDPEATITFNDNKELRIQAESVEAMPAQVSEPEPVESIDELSDTEVIIRATDLDSAKRGWAAVIPSLSERRVKLQLDLNIDSEFLMSNPHIRGDITVAFMTDEKDVKQPKLVLLRKITYPEKKKATDHKRGERVEK